MSPSRVQIPDTAKMVAEHPHLLSILTVDLKVVEVKYIITRLTYHLKTISTNARDTTSSQELRDHYQEQEKLLVALIVKLQQALDKEPESEQPTD